MDSDDSRDASSGNESEDNDQETVRSRSRSKDSNLSRSRSSSAQSRTQSPGSGTQDGPRSPSPAAQSNRSRSHSSSTSSYEGSQSRSRLDPDSRPQSSSSVAPSRESGAQSRASRSPSPTSRPSSTPQSPVAVQRSPSPSSAIRSPSPQSVPISPDVRRSRSLQSFRKSASPDSANSSRSSSPGSPARGPREKSPSRSASSTSSKKSRSRSSSRSESSGRRSRDKSRDGNTSDSSVSSIDSSSRKNKSKADTQPEAISDGDMESDNEKDSKVKKEEQSRPVEINISHEDLSDVSDLDESIGGHSEEEAIKLKEKLEPEERPGEKSESIKQNGDGGKSPPSSPDKKLAEKPSRPEETAEEQLDFEAEDGECNDSETKDDDKELCKEGDGQIKEKKPEKEKEELEEGEVTDEDDVRPEETEPRPVCRFFSRGACTWGASCRFLHPGVTDKGNYTMFEMIRPVVPGDPYMPRDERMFAKPEPPVVESAWERGLRTAKEMLRKSIKRKEQDIDFEEKKMNLSIAQEEFDKENGYVYGRLSPEPRYVRHIPAEYPTRVPPEDYYRSRQMLYEQEYAAQQQPPRERVRPYREMPAHRIPDYYSAKYEEEAAAAGRGNASGNVRRPKREVTVQRPSGGGSEDRPGRGDEWQDPWMRSKSPGRRKERKRSYSSGSSSYSSSSSSRSSSSRSSSYRSRSRSRQRRTSRSRSRRDKRVSPSVIVSERKAANERAALMNPPAPKRRAPSPSMMRVNAAANPPAPSREDPLGRNRNLAATLLARVNKTRHRSRSSSASSSGSSSDTDSSESSSSSSRSNSPEPRRADIAKAMDVLKSGTLEKNKIKLNLKNPVGLRKPSIESKVEVMASKKRPANSPPPGDKNSKKATSRREELLKQLKAVEDAIAKKRSKVN